MSQPDLDAVRRSISENLDNLISGHRAMEAQGLPGIEQGEWLQLRDIVARIERKLKANQPEETTT